MWRAVVNGETKIKLALAFILLNALDIALTLYFVGRGVSTELNPVMSRVLSYSLPAVLAYKVLVPALLVVIIIILSKQAMFRVKWNLILVMLVVGEAGICLFNTTALIWS